MYERKNSYSRSVRSSSSQKSNTPSLLDWQVQQPKISLSQARTEQPSYSSGKYLNTWKQYLLPQFREKQTRGSSLTKQDSFSLNRSSRQSFNPVINSPTYAPQSDPQASDSDICHTAHFTTSSKRKAINHYPYDQKQLKFILQQNSLLHEEVDYLRKKLQSIMTSKTKGLRNR